MVTAQHIINQVSQTGKLTPAAIEALEEQRQLRLSLVEYGNRDRQFVLSLLQILMTLRRESSTAISGDSLMLACYLLGKCGQVEDCLTIWQAKRIDFDTYAYIDGQLVVFAGVQATVAFLESQHSEEAKLALAYVLACIQAGDFDNLQSYHQELPWYI